jgi:predicted esterase YcpF (UPF0227 family)
MLVPYTKVYDLITLNTVILNPNVAPERKINTAMQTDYVQGSAQHAGDTSIEPGAAQSQFLRVFCSDRDSKRQ